LIAAGPSRSRDRASRSPGRPCGDAAGEIGPADLVEPRLAHHLGEAGLIGKPADAFHQVLIGLAVAGDPLADLRDHLERIGVIGGAQRLGHGPREFQAQEPPAGFQHAPGLAQGGGDVGHVADAEGDHIGVGAGVGQRQRLSVADAPGDFRRPAALAAGGDHLGVVVDDEDPRVVPHSIRGVSQLRLAGQLGEPHRHVAGAAGAVDDGLAWARIEARRGHVLPEPVHARAHQVVHQVVAAGHAVEHAAHQARLVGGIDILKTKGRGRLGHDRLLACPRRPRHPPTMSA